MEEKQINEVLRRGTNLQARKDLSPQILASWKAQKDPIPSLVPIIPKWVGWGISSFFLGIFVWGFAKMSTSPVDSIIGYFLQNVFQKIEYSFVGLEEIALPTVAVLMVLIILNAVLLKYRFQGVRV